MDFNYISIDIDGQLFGFRELDQQDKDLLIQNENSWFRESDNYFFKLSSDISRSSDNIRDNSDAVSREILTPKKIPDYVYDEHHTNKIRLEKLDKCQLLILCLLSAESFYRVENNSFAINQNVFKTTRDPSLRGMTFEQLEEFIRPKSNQYWIKNDDAFYDPQSILNNNNRADPSWMAKWTWAMHIKGLTDLVYINYRIVSFNHLINELRNNCSVNQTILGKYISYGQVVVYKCYQEVIEGRVTEQCYAMLAQTRDINYESESQLKIVWGD